jgi:ABC-2 type transport system permease protein
MNKLKQRYLYSIILLKQLVKTDFKIRYQNSVLGYLWSLLRPLALFLILYIIFVRFLKVGNAIPHYPVYLLVGIVIWNYFVEVTVGSIGAIVGKGDIMRKINFPRYVIVLAGSVSALINLSLNFVVVAIFLFVSKVDIHPSVVLLPLLIIELFAFSLAIAFLLSAAFVRLRDISYVWEVVIQGAFYATPILYPLNVIPLKAAKLLMLSPIAQIIQDIRYILVTDHTQTIATVYKTHWARLIPLGITALTVIISAIYFRKRSRYFAEDV